MHTNPLANPLAPVRPQQPPAEPARPVASQPVTPQPTIGDRMERAKESIRDAAHNVKEGIMQPVDRVAERARTGAIEHVQAYDHPYLNLINGYETVFVIDDSAATSARDWAHLTSALLRLLPLATLHNACGGITVYTASGTQMVVSSEEQVGHYVLKQLHQSSEPADVHAMVRRTLADRMGKMDQSGSKPLNLIVMSSSLPDPDTENAMVDAAKAGHSSFQHPLRMLYSLTRNDEMAQREAGTFADRFAAANHIDDIVDCAALPSRVDLRDKAQDLLVGKIGTWASETVPL